MNFQLWRDGAEFAIQIGSDWLQMGQIWDLLRSVSVYFGSSSQNVLKSDLKTTFPSGVNLTSLSATYKDYTADTPVTSLAISI